MRSIAFIPFTFVAGVEGFGWFVGYLIFILMVLEIRRVVRTLKPIPASVNPRVPMPSSDIEFEIAHI